MGSFFKKSLFLRRGCKTDDESNEEKVMVEEKMELIQD